MYCVTLIDFFLSDITYIGIFQKNFSFFEQIVTKINKYCKNMDCFASQESRNDALLEFFAKSHCEKIFDFQSNPFFENLYKKTDKPKDSNILAKQAFFSL